MCSLRCSAKTRDDRGATPHETPESSCRHIFGSVSTDHFQTTRTCMLSIHFSPHLERTWLLHRQLPLWSGAGAWRRASCNATHCQITKYHIAVSCTGHHTPYIRVKILYSVQRCRRARVLAAGGGTALSALCWSLRPETPRATAET